MSSNTICSLRAAVALAVLAAGAFAQSTGGSPAGKWISNLKVFDNNNYDRLELSLKGTALTGKLGTNAFEGTFENGRIQGIVKPDSDTTIHLDGRLAADGRIEGTATAPEQKINAKWEARREPAAADAPRLHNFEPTQFQHHFSGSIDPVLHIHSGDSVKTWSVDAGGYDPHGVRRTSGGNPLTGPFYVDGAIPGDTLAVHFDRLRLNRDTAVSGGRIAGNALNPGYVENRKRIKDYDSDWKLDREAGFAMLKNPTEALKSYRVPLAPMLGCVGVAPPGGMQYRSGFLGSFGGNMDYNQLREGTTVYLPVYALGALLSVGDGHALQGAGELTGDALETSMDIQFTVTLEPGKSPPAPRMENSEYFMASGIAGSLDDALRGATTNLVTWLEKRYGLNSSEVSSVLGTAMVYEVAEVVDPQVHVVAKAPKSLLAALQPAKGSE